MPKKQFIRKKEARTFALVHQPINNFDNVDENSAPLQDRLFQEITPNIDKAKLKGKLAFLKGFDDDPDLIKQHQEEDSDDLCYEESTDDDDARVTFSDRNVTWMEIPKVNHSTKKEAGEAAKYGIYFNDTEYDYLQHLKPIGKTPGSVYISSTNSAPILKPSKLNANTLFSIKEQESHEDSVLRPIIKEDIDIDPNDPDMVEILAALNDDAYINETLENDLIEENISKALEVEEEELQREIDQVDRNIPSSKNILRKERDIDQQFDEILKEYVEDEEIVSVDWKSDDSLIEDSDISLLENAMSGASFSDFEDVFDEFLNDETKPKALISEDKIEEIESSNLTKKEKLKMKGVFELDEFRKALSDVTLIRKEDEYISDITTEESSDDEPEINNSKRWDRPVPLNDILNTQQTQKSFIPIVIKENSFDKSKKIILSKKSGLPLTMIEQEEQIEEMDIIKKVNKGEARKKEESPEEKKLRKQSIKLEKKLKKQNKSS